MTISMARITGILITALALGLGMAHAAAAHRANAADRAIAGAVAERVTAGRLAAQLRWHPCEEDGHAALVVRSRCGRIPPPGSKAYQRLARTAGKARVRLRSDTSAAARHALALTALRWHEAAPVELDRAVTTLDQARRAKPNDPDILNDLAVAYLAVGERDQQLRPMLRALDTVEQSLARDSAHVSALFNRALILDRLYLRASARRAWARYLAREHDPDWRKEAEARLGVAPEPPNADIHEDLDRPIEDTMAAGLVRRAPDHGRQLGFGVLEQWGLETLGGDSARAARLLVRALSLASAQDSLAADRSAAGATRIAANRSLSSTRRRTLARAHVDFGIGWRLFTRREFVGAVQPLEAAERGFRTQGDPSAGWAAFYLAASYVSLGRYERGDSAFQRVFDRAHPDQPTLSGKALLGLGVSQLRRGNYERASELYAAAEPYIARAREPETAGFAAYLKTEVFGYSGKAAEREGEAFLGLRLLSPFRRSNYLNNHLLLVARIARGEGLSRAALVFMNEVLAAAPDREKPDAMALALCTRARDLITMGRAAEAEIDLRAAAAWVDSMPRDAMQSRVRAAVLLTRGEIMRASDPGAALPLLAAAVDSFRRFTTDRNLPEALYQAALAARAADEPVLSRGWLLEALEATERQQAVFREAAGRALFAETIERISDEMISAELADGRADSAFAYLERARVAAWPTVVPAPFRGLTPEQVRRRLPPDLLLAEYALLGDRLAVWSISRDGWQVQVLPVSRDSVRALVSRLPGELSTATRDVPPALARLYDLLLRPLGAMATDGRRVVVVPDRELHGVPFVALRNRDDGRFAIETWEFRTVPSAAFLLATLAFRAPDVGGRVPLVVGNPVLDSAAAVRLGELPGAGREAIRVAGLYPGSNLLTRENADRQRVLAMLPKASILHFAGHAVFDPERPERSYLALSSNHAEGGRLLAAEIGALRPSKLEVVVLSACSTLNPRPSRAGGVAGLAYSFLNAGALATISTLWDVRDGDVSDVLVTFHQERQRGRPTADALRSAQLRALHSASPDIRAPRTWAAFTYTGP
jgi:CHAT domain-containing protein